MVIAGNNPLYGRFDEMVNILLEPQPPRILGYVLRCADLYCGDGEATWAAYHAGLETTYAYDTDESACEAYLEKFGQEPFSGTTGDSVRLPIDFDFLLVRIDGNALTTPPQRRRGRQKYDAPVEHALRFLRVRKPVGILFWGRDLPSGFTSEIDNAIEDDAARYGYSTGTHSGPDGLEYALAMRAGDFTWPDNPGLEDVIRAMNSAAQETVIQEDARAP